MQEQKWFTLDDVENISSDDRIELTRQYVNPGMVKLFGILGFSRFWAKSAKGLHIECTDGKTLLDMTGGNGVLALGHNHPAIIKARRKMGDENRLEICKSFLSPYFAALASNLAKILPEDLQYSFFCGSGAEAIEGALKMAEKAAGPQRQAVAYTDHCFHGKSHAAMSVSSADATRGHFKLLDDCHEVPYGDIQALEKLFGDNLAQDGKSRFCAFVLEPIHGSQLIFPPEGYLTDVCRLCRKYGVAMIVDEIYTGFGHTGDWFAFEHEKECVPDIVCYSKSFGGGKASLAGYTARPWVFDAAYGNPDDSMMHSSTFSGMSEECATAIETMDVIRRDNLLENARQMGDYLGKRLGELAAKHPKRIKDVRGRGLLWGVELFPALKQLLPIIGKVMPGKAQILPTLTGVVALTELFFEHDILAYLGFTRRNMVVYSPAIIATKQDIDRAVDALDAILSKSWISLGQAFIKRQLKK